MKRCTLRLCKIQMTMLAMILVASARSQNPSPTIKVSEVVLGADGASQALVSAQEENRPLRGLAAANFQVTVDRKNITPLLLAPSRSSQTGISVVLAIDVSGSMQKVGLEGAIRGASQFVDHLQKEDMCALVTFGSSVRQIVDFTDDHERIKKALTDLKAVDRQTDLYLGVFDSLDLAANAPTSRSAVIVLTDGVDEGSPLGAQDVLVKIASRDVPVYTLGFGRSVDEDVLIRFAAASHGSFFRAPQASDISSAYLQVSEELQNDYLLSWKLTTPPKPSSQVVVTLQYRGKLASTSLTVNSSTAKPGEFPSEKPERSVRWWPWAAALAVLILAAAFWGYREYERRRVPDLAATMVPPRVWLEVVKGADMGQKAIVFDKDAVIGRDPRMAQILIKSDPLVGRRHARLLQNEGGQYVIEDLKSQNGVAVNGVKIAGPVTLRSEDRVLIGLTELLFIDQR